MSAKSVKTSVPADVHVNLPALKAVLTLAKSCRYEPKHTHQVERLSLQLFDLLARLHRLGGKEKFLLRCGALLHDIGAIKGPRGHNKTAMKIIMESDALPFDFHDKSIIALLARYHRKRPPSGTDAYYCRLSAKDKTIVQKLAFILRLADALDRTHRSLVEDIRCKLSAARITLTCSSDKPLDAEFAAAGKKTDPFKPVFRKNLVFRRKSS